MYDSGVGGLRILQYAIDVMPNTSFLYYADEAAMPLGDKTIDEIQTRTKDALTIMFEQGCDLVILACNTASVNSIRHIQQVWLKEHYPQKQVLSVTRPLTELAKASLESNQLLSSNGILLCTQSTYSSGFYQYELYTHGLSNLRIIPCKGLADIIEIDNQSAVKDYLQNLIQTYNIDVQMLSYIILGCTHYEWIVEQLESVFPQSIIIAPADYTAQSLVQYINKHPEFDTTKQQTPSHKLIVNGDLHDTSYLTTMYSEIVAQI